MRVNLRNGNWMMSRNMAPALASMLLVCGCGCIIFLPTQQNFRENVLGRVHNVHRDFVPIVNILVSKSISELGFRLQIYVIKHENQK